MVCCRILAVLCPTELHISLQKLTSLASAEWAAYQKRGALYSYLKSYILSPSSATGRQHASSECESGLEPGSGRAALAYNRVYILVLVIINAGVIICAMVNTRVLSTKRRNAVRCRNCTRSPKSDRTPQKRYPSIQAVAMNVFWLNSPKAIPFLASYAKAAKSDRTPPNCPWHRIIQGVSANAHTG